MEVWLPDDLVLKIVKERAVSEITFFIDYDDKIHLRWFTSKIEMDHCGRATFAKAHCLKTIYAFPLKNADYIELS